MSEINSPEELFAAAEGVTRQVVGVHTSIGRVYLRTLSAAEYLYFCEHTDNATLVCLAWCNKEGDGLAAWSNKGKVAIKEETKKKLESEEFPGDVLQCMVKAALTHCFPDGDVEKNSESGLAAA